MSEAITREDRLLRMVGEAGSAHAPEVREGAERELARRAGGTRRQAVGRIRASGAFIIFLGLVLGGLAAGLYVAIVILWGPQPGLTDAAVTSGAIGLLGLAVLGLGLAVLLRVGWVVRKARYIPFLRAADVEVATYEPDTAELLRTIGPLRTESSPDAVREAEGRLRERLRTGREQRQARVRSWGGVAATLGALMVLNGVGIGFILLLLQALQGLEPGLAGEELVSGADVTATWIGAVVNAAVGAVLLAGGVGLRRHTNWGRRAVLWSVWISLAATLAASALAGPQMVARSGFGLDVDLSLLGTVIIDVVWLGICWRVTKVLCLPEVKEVCGVQTPLPRGLRR